MVLKTKQRSTRESLMGKPQTNARFSWANYMARSLLWGYKTVYKWVGWVQLNPGGLFHLGAHNGPKCPGP